MEFLKFCILLGALAMAFAQDNSERCVLVIHGGAGDKKPKGDESEDARRAILAEALARGHKILKQGGSSVETVEAVIKILEDAPLFNAGKGSVFTSEGKNELDASIMDGRTLNAGAVAAVTTIKNPISAARKVMEQSPHVLLVGQGAEKFAGEVGIEIVPNSYFFVEKRWKDWQELQKRTQTQEAGQDAQYHTVGAVALDRFGNLAAGTSTGGMSNKRFGRVGDSPIIGAGNYANNDTCAVSATGHGEYFMRCVAAYDISAMMEYRDLPLDEAVGEVLKKLEKLGGHGGVIAVDKNGNAVMAFNTEIMYRGYVKADGEVKVFVYQDQ